MISLKDHRPSTAKLKRHALEKIVHPAPKVNRQGKKSSTIIPRSPSGADEPKRCGLNDGVAGSNQEPLRGIKTAIIGFGLLSGDPCFIHLNADTEEGRAFLNLCLKKIMKKRPYQRLLKQHARGRE